MKREEITSVIDHTAHENEAIAHLGNTVQSILLMIIQETLKNVMGGGGVRIIQYGVLGRNETSRATANDWLFFLGGGGGG